MTALDLSLAEGPAKDEASNVFNWTVPGVGSKGRLLIHSSLKKRSVKNGGSLWE